jgi:hypothetical protein
MQISKEEIERRQAVVPRRSPKTLSPISRCRISTDRASEAGSPRMAVHAATGRGKTRGWHSKGNFARETEGTHPLQIWSVSWYSLGAEPPTAPPHIEDRDTRRACTRTPDTYPTQLVHDAPKMHLHFPVLCFIFCSRIISYLNKTAESDAVFSKVSFMAIFARNKIREKYYANFSCEGG